MDVTYESTDAFEKDLASFQMKERTRTIDKLNLYCSLLPADRAGFFKHATRPVIPVLRSKLQSSLYSIRVSRDIRVLATIDNDPLFDQVIVTLLRAVRKKDIDNVFKGLAQSLYQSDIVSFREQEGRDNG
jgi:hypothetical protein